MCESMRHVGGRYERRGIPASRQPEQIGSPVEKAFKLGVAVGVAATVADINGGTAEKARSVSGGGGVKNAPKPASGTRSARPVGGNKRRGTRPERGSAAPDVQVIKANELPAPSGADVPASEAVIDVTVEAVEAIGAPTSAPEANEPGGIRGLARKALSMTFGRGAKNSADAGAEEIASLNPEVAATVNRILSTAVAQQRAHVSPGSKKAKKAAKAWQRTVMFDLNEALGRPADLNYGDSEGRSAAIVALRSAILQQVGHEAVRHNLPNFLK